MIGSAAPLAAGGEPAPTFQVDPFWPKTLPNDWLLGAVAGVAVDGDDNVWVVQRPASLTPDERAAEAKPPQARCCRAAPPVIEFAHDGTLLRAWGGKDERYDWPESEHGIFVDAKGFVWISGAGLNDGQVLKFTQDGKFVLQIGKPGPQTNSNDTTRLGRATGFAYDLDADELYVADGYHNRRVIVFDATTGAYKRHWGAYGGRPVDPTTKSNTTPEFEEGVAGGPPSRQFGTPVHCVKISHDGLVYVCDRTQNRVQVFRKDGSFVTEFFTEVATRGIGSVWDLAFYGPAQEYLLLIDGTNNEVRILRRSDGMLIGRVGRSGRNAGSFHWVHGGAVGRTGDLFTVEVETGKRIQRFVPVGLSHLAAERGDETRRGKAK